MKKPLIIEKTIQTCLDDINLKLDNHIAHYDVCLKTIDDRIEKMEVNFSNLKTSHAELRVDLGWIKWISVTVLLLILGLIGKTFILRG